MSRKNSAHTSEAPPAAAAADYLARAWSVLPVQFRSKHPLIAREGLQAKRPSAAQVSGWFRRWPDANVGIVTGEISNLVVVDIDLEHGGENSLGALQRHFGTLPETVEAKTGGGGRHLYFTHPGRPCRNRAGLARGIDLRGDGGYVVAPPSIHPSGAGYGWVPGHSPAELPLAPLPRWLTRIGGSRAGRSLTEWRNLVRVGVPEGQRNSTPASLAGHLLWHGVDPEIALELLMAWNRVRCRPPLSDNEAAQVVHSIVRRHRTKNGSMTEPHDTRIVDRRAS
jgi:hypothetical protein